jgi:hypothetical protein
MDKMTLTTDLINGILQYLGSRPFVEVAGLINAIQQQAAEQGASAPMTASASTDVSAEASVQ